MAIKFQSAFATPAAAIFSLLISGVFYLVAFAFYNLYLNPLSRFPGPKLWAISRIPYVRSMQKGLLARRTKELHEQYGPIVRLGPDELSFVDKQAWHDIYAHHQGRPVFMKNPDFMRPAVNGVHTILSANDADHSRFRRLLTHAFSDKALRAQESLLQSYVDLFISRLDAQIAASAEGTAAVDIGQWFNFMSFDIIGDLAFGESFHCLENSNYHPWVAMFFAHFKASTFAISCRFIPGMESLMSAMVPKAIVQKKIDHFKMTQQRVHKRLKEGDSPHMNDFMTYLCRYNDEKGMTVPEIEATSAILVIAGSETTATALSAMVHHLLKYPDIMETLLHEIRGRFKHSSEITMENVTKLTFLNAVIEEAMRLCPPVPIGLPRLVPSGGGVVSGYHLPGNTRVSVTSLAGYSSTTNFSHPATFSPQRWLSQTEPIHEARAFNPFSLGPRNCIGKHLAYLEMRLIVTKLLWNFDLERDGEDWDWNSQKTFVIWERRPLRVKLRKFMR